MKVFASEEHPVMLCKTCGLATSRVIKRRSTTLRNVKRKTWKRTIKDHPHAKVKKHTGKYIKQKEIFFSYVMLECIHKKHKIHIYKKPFTKKLFEKLVT